MATLIMCIDEIVVGLFYRNVVKYFGVAYNIVMVMIYDSRADSGECCLT
jgi:hypothetical protein